jgi:RNA polymerase sigma-70 factor (ECF subfamily)
MTSGRFTAIPGGIDADEGVLRAAASGDERAVRKLYREHLDRVYRCVARILGSSDPDVEDVVQQVFLAALDGAPKFDGRSRVSTWIVGIASRRALAAGRCRWRRQRWAEVTEGVGVGRRVSAPDARLDALALAEAALAALSPEQRTAFVLHEVEGYTFEEIREMTGTGISTLHARVKAARTRLDCVLAEQGQLEGGDR